MICPNCKADNLFEDAKFCPSCGCQLSSPPKEHSSPDQTEPGPADEALDFVVTEASNSGGPELVGTDSRPVGDNLPRENLDISGPADLLESETDRNRHEQNPKESDPGEFAGKSESTLEDEDDELVTQDNFIPPPVEEPITNTPAQETDFGDLNEGRADQQPDPMPSETSRPQAETAQDNTAEKPAPPDIPAWEEPVLNKKDKPLPEQPKPEMTTQMFAAPRSEINQASPGPESKSDQAHRAFPGSTPESPPPQETTPPEPAPAEFNNTITPIPDPSLKSKAEVKKATRMRGLANFKGNYIRLVGNAYLHENDEISVGGKAYVLKPYQFGKKFKLYGIAAIFVVAMLVVGSFFISPIVGDDGKIVGMVLNEYSQPYVAGAKVTIKELGKSTRTNPQGFFEFEMVPTGTYEFIFETNGKTVGRGNATVVAGQTTMMTFGNLSQNYADRAGSDEISSITEEEATSPPPEPKETKGTASKKKSSNQNSGFGKIKLAANVDGAKFVVDGKTLGAGNNTYARISPGKHKINVSLDGYTEHTEVINVASG